MIYSDLTYTTLRGELQAAQYQGLDDEAAADALNMTQTVANPVAQATVNLRFTWDTFIGLLTAAEIVTLYGHGNLASDLRRALETNARVELLALWRGVKAVLGAATVTKVETEFGKNQPDPDWEPEITLPSRAEVLELGGTVTGMDVARARAGRW